MRGHERDRPERSVMEEAQECMCLGSVAKAPAVAVISEHDAR